MTIPLTVFICSHARRFDHLTRVLDGLKAQTLPRAEWELILVDNASPQPLADVFDLSWHPNARHVREEQLGLNHARLRGMAEAAGAVLVVLDDDTIPDPDYIEVAWRIALAHPDLGVYSGQLRPEFEAEPPGWVRPYFNCLGLRELSGNTVGGRDISPAPTGVMCLRSTVARAYQELVRTTPLRRELGRRGGRLLACEDVDLVRVAADTGYQLGMFEGLRLTHLIPAARLTEAYLVRWWEGHYASMILVNALRGTRPPPLAGWLTRAWRRLRPARGAPVQRHLGRAWHRAVAIAHDVLAEHSGT